jgi:hypothetical protein
MGDLLMIVITVSALALCQFYVKWCDRIATADLAADMESTRVAEVEVEVEEVTA